MTQEAHELLQKALTLPENERAELAGNLMSSLDTALKRVRTTNGGRRSRVAWKIFNPAK